MGDSSDRGFPKEYLRARYDVSRIDEDPWHTFSGMQTKKILDKYIRNIPDKSPYLLNAGSSFYSIDPEKWIEISIDIFRTPLLGKPASACANVENMPFADNSFGAAVCVGEVLAYCDPAKAIKEFSRILEPGGQFIFDFGSSAGLKYRNTTHFGKVADIATDFYNGSKENIWVYNPLYIESLLKDFGFKISGYFGTHGISSLVRKLGFNSRLALAFERRLNFVPFPVRFSEVITYVAFQQKASK